jgi:hypothetical protein
MKEKSWIEEAWEYSRMAIENDLPTTIEAFYEYQLKKNGNNTTNKGVDSERGTGNQGSAQGSDI